VVCEAALEPRLIRDVMALGAKGYTIADAHGTGPRNQRNGDLEGGNIRLEVVAEEATVVLILEQLEKDYFPHYAVSAWVSDVEILRPDRY
jgi:nitrogen regulatory protein P-II 2